MQSAKTGRRAKREPVTADPDPVPDDTTAEDLEAAEETKPVCTLHILSCIYCLLPKDQCIITS